MAKSQTERSKDYIAKYGIKQLKADIKPEDYALIDTYSKKHGISKAKLIVESIKYCIENRVFENFENSGNEK